MLASIEIVVPGPEFHLLSALPESLGRDAHHPPSKGHPVGFIEEEFAKDW